MKFAGQSHLRRWRQDTPRSTKTIPKIYKNCCDLIMADEDTILEARKFVPHYNRQITWSAQDRLWQVLVPELPGCTASGDSAEGANRNADEQILLYLLNRPSQTWPVPKRLKA